MSTAVRPPRGAWAVPAFTPAAHTRARTHRDRHAHPRSVRTHVRRYTRTPARTRIPCTRIRACSHARAHVQTHECVRAHRLGVPRPTPRVQQRRAVRSSRPLRLLRALPRLVRPGPRASPGDLHRTCGGSASPRGEHRVLLVPCPQVTRGRDAGPRDRQLLTPPPGDGCAKKAGEAGFNRATSFFTQIYTSSTKTCSLLFTFPVSQRRHYCMGGHIVLSCIKLKKIHFTSSDKPLKFSI